LELGSFRFIRLYNSHRYIYLYKFAKGGEKKGKQIVRIFAVIVRKMTTENRIEVSCFVVEDKAVWYTALASCSAGNSPHSKSIELNPFPTGIGDELNTFVFHFGKKIEN